jgi:hypothetical protein
MRIHIHESRRVFNITGRLMCWDFKDSITREVITMSTKEVWFSHKERKWEVKNREFSWTDKKEIWEWDNCTIGLARTPGDELIVVVRSKTNKNSRYMGDKPVELRFMLGFKVTEVEEPQIETYTARENNPEKREGPKERWVFHLKDAALGDDYCIWEWAKEGGEITSSNTYRLYQSIREELSSPLKKSDNIFDVELKDRGDRVIPVIYQPAVDSLNNFVREVHCSKKPAKADGSYEVEVTIIFNNEQLRKHAYGGILNKIYEEFRRLYHGRTLDIESFKIFVMEDVDNNKFIFEKIYSDNYQLEDDDVHGDKENAPKRSIKYYFINHNHPVVFINTSNHAMAEHDTNHRIWKWEYVPWMDNAPIKLGNKTRKEIEKGFKPILKFW